MKNNGADQVYETIGRRIVAARKAKSMSQEKLAAESGVDRSHMGYIEQGRRRPTVSTLYRIARSLDIKLADLFKDF